jgi:hypothetical protein
VKSGFANIFFLTLFPITKYIFIQKVVLEMYVLKCVKILGKVVKIRVFM